jgi:hypothetical protein
MENESHIIVGSPAEPCCEIVGEVGLFVACGIEGQGDALKQVGFGVWFGAVDVQLLDAVVVECLATEGAVWGLYADKTAGRKLAPAHEVVKARERTSCKICDRREYRRGNPRAMQRYSSRGRHHSRMRGAE